MPGIRKTPGEGLARWGKNCPTPGEYAICMATCGNGVMTFIRWTIIRKAQRKILEAQKPAIQRFYEAVAGIHHRSNAAHPFAIMKTLDILMCVLDMIYMDFGV